MSQVLIFTLWLAGKYLIIHLRWFLKGDLCDLDLLSAQGKAVHYLQSVFPAVELARVCLCCQLYFPSHTHRRSLETI